MVNRARILVICVAWASASAVPLSAHEGHKEAPSEQTVQGDPIVLSPEAKKNLDLKTAKATVRAIESTLKASGVIEAIPGSREVVSSKISGRVLEVRAALGDRKNKGDILLVLEARQLSETPVRVRVPAPRSGKVARLHVLPGEAVEPGSGLLELADYGEVYAKARVYESRIGAIAKGMPARVHSPFLKKEIPSKVAIIGSEVNPQTRTVDVWLKIRNPDEALKVNMAVTVHFLSGREDETIVIPRSAVLGAGGDRFVFVEEGNAYRRTAIVTGTENDRWIEVIEGLSPGDVVVTQGNYQLQFAKPRSDK